MCGKFTCGMIIGLMVGAGAVIGAKYMVDKRDINKIKKKAKRLLSKVEDCVCDVNPFSK